MRFRSVAPTPIYVDTPMDVEECLHRCMESTLLGVDTESMGLEKDFIKMVDQVVNMGLSPDEGARYFIPRRNLHHFRDLLASKIPKALHNYKWDAHRLANAGVEIGGPVWETMIFDFLLDEDTRENRHGLDMCSLDYFGIPMAKYSDVVGEEDPTKIKPGHPRWGSYLDYGSLDPWVTRKLAVVLGKKLQKIKLFHPDAYQEQADAGEISLEELEEILGRTMWDHYWEYEEPQVKALYRMERRGIRLNDSHLEKVAESMEEEMTQNARELSRLVGYPINPNSSKQVQKWLFEDLKLKPLKKTAGGQPSVDEWVLNEFLKQGVDGINLILAYRQASKLKGTYALGLLKWIHIDGKIHTSYSPIKVTGRLSSDSPNLQNIPRPDWDIHKIRAAFVPDSEDDILIVVDYGQLEMRVLASAAEAYGDPTMAEGIRSGLDMHSFTGAKMLGIEYEEFITRKEAGEQFILDVRQAAKAINFGIVYGIASQGLAVQLTKALKRPVGEAEAQGYINSYLESFPGVGTYMSAQRSSARNLGYVQTIAGRFRRLSAARSRRPQERLYAYRQAINAPVQGSAADIVKKALIILDNHPELAKLGCSARLQVHDEFVFNKKGGRLPENKADLDKCVEIIVNTMVRMFEEQLSVPLVVDVALAENWSEAKG